MNPGAWTVVLLRQHNCSEAAGRGAIRGVEGVGFLAWKVTSLPFPPWEGLCLGRDGEESMGGDDDGIETTVEERIESVTWNQERGWFEVELAGHFAPGIETTVEQMTAFYPGWNFVRYYDGNDSWTTAMQQRHRMIRGASTAVRAAGPKRGKKRP